MASNLTNTADTGKNTEELIDFPTHPMENDNSKVEISKPLHGTTGGPTPCARRELPSEPDENGASERNIIEEREIEARVKGVAIPVETTKFPSVPELGAPGSSVVADVLVPHRLDCKRSFSSIEGCSGADIIQKIPSTTYVSDNDTLGRATPPSVRTAINIIPPLTPAPLVIKNQTMENKDTTNLKRKRKGPCAGNPKQKKAKTMAELKKVPACKSCYHKHIGCDRPTENEPCRACEKRKQPCERNDVRVVKGEKVVVREHPTSGTSHQGFSLRNIAEGSVGTPSGGGTPPLGQNDGEPDENRCERGAEDGVTIDAPGQNEEATGSPQPDTGIESYRYGEEGNISTEEDTGFTDMERDAVNTLMTMKDKKVVLLDNKACICYFETIRRILLEKPEDAQRIKEGLDMLEELKRQLIWLNRHVDGHSSKASP
ncbi:hypothetical protein TWF730_010439 [Orbilia blumenaviensis]|uniref:Zn(2)-C6 fungal-type domain-containing protein n=1 Tax=Orbilia blumenaviensis TaxID=1796055 RepID=A0AAV9UPT6_9PEZI